MENWNVSEYPKDEGSFQSSSKSFKLFGQVIKSHATKENEGNTSSTSNVLEVQRGTFLGPKVLTKSDTDSSSRLLLGRDIVYSKILPFLDTPSARRCETVDGTRINVHDLDTNSAHELVLKMWKSNSFVLTGNWNKDFVNRRNLLKGDEIGLYWDNNNSTLNFTVLKKHGT
ncbi:hypothetical protein M9H77_02192 [Catharanthus roseus]|uniref:Uncharacterized protein n=1 Tax=Catharanthus roseus TaxID=4058 RepID=A0ACC0C7V8_CATRO|nr:hypothetical protein M9H77_02192 [Catharanthus roseus]